MGGLDIWRRRQNTTRVYYIYMYRTYRPATYFRTAEWAQDDARLSVTNGSQISTNFVRSASGFWARARIRYRTMIRVREENIREPNPGAITGRIFYSDPYRTYGLGIFARSVVIYARNLFSNRIPGRFLDFVVSIPPPPVPVPSSSLGSLGRVVDSFERVTVNYIF